MVIFQIRVIGIASVKAKGHAPVGPYRHCSVAFTIAFERMQSKRGLAHILHVTGLIQR